MCVCVCVYVCMCKCFNVIVIYSVNKVYTVAPHTKERKSVKLYHWLL